MWRHRRSLFKISQKTIIIFWLVIIAIILGVYFFAPAVFYRLIQTPYQETPFVNPPNR